MYDPSTVAHEIKYPWRGPKSKFWPEGYRSSFITIWHEDPQKDAHAKGTRGDDTCGWFHPPTTPEDREAVRALGKGEYSTIWGRQAAEADGKDYAYVCFVPSAYDAIYWTWRSIKHELRGRKPGWKFGEGRRYLSQSELDEIYMLASNPIDNLRLRFEEVDGPEKAADFFGVVHRCYARHHRPWWRHPRWHVHHWRFQIHPLQQLRRVLFDRCDGCGRGFAWGYSPTSNGHDKLWHNECYPSGALVPNAATGTWEAISPIVSGRQEGSE